MEKKKAAQARAKAKLLAKDPDYYKEWRVKDRIKNPDKYRQYEANRPDTKERSKRYYETNKHKIVTRQKSRLAVKKGILIKPSVCDGCDLPKELQIDHWDYSDHLNVNWYCRECHTLVTRTRLRAGIIQS